MGYGCRRGSPVEHATIATIAPPAADALQTLQGRLRQELAFSLTLSDDPALSCHDVDQLARHDLIDIQQRMRELRRIARALERTIASCAGGKRGQCAILGALRQRSTQG